MSRISLTGVEPSLVQAALGQLVQLFCADDTSLDPHIRWQKDGQPISSDRCVWESSPGGSPSDFSWAGKVSVGLLAHPPGALGPEGGWAHYGSQEPRVQAPTPSFRHRLQPDGSLVISPLRAEDAGTYSCGSSRPDRDSQKIQLRITGLCPPPPEGSYWP